MQNVDVTAVNAYNEKERKNTLTSVAEISKPVPLCGRTMS